MKGIAKKKFNKKLMHVDKSHFLSEVKQQCISENKNNQDEETTNLQTGSIKRYKVKMRGNTNF